MLALSKISNLFRRNGHEKPMGLRGTYRVQIVDEDGSVKGDSGWKHNQIVNDGYRYFLTYALGSIAGSASVTHMALGSGTAPASNATALGSEVGSRAAVSAASSSTSKTVRFTATFAAGWVTTTYNISNIGLYNSSSTGSFFAGSSFTSSSCASNQAVNCTYDITYA